MKEIASREYTIETPSGEVIRIKEIEYDWSVKREHVPDFRNDDVMDPMGRNPCHLAATYFGNTK